MHNDLLKKNPVLEADGKPNIELPFICSRLTIICLINRGHRYQDDAMFSSGLVTTIKNIRNRSPNAIIIYEASMIIRDAMERKSHWISCQLGVIALSLDDIHRQNLIVRGMVGSGRQDYRIDGHIGGQDCLR